MNALNRKYFEEYGDCLDKLQPKTLLEDTLKCLCNMHFLYEHKKELPNYPTHWKTLAKERKTDRWTYWHFYDQYLTELERHYHGNP